MVFLQTVCFTLTCYSEKTLILVEIKFGLGEVRSSHSFYFNEQKILQISKPVLFCSVSWYSYFIFPSAYVLSFSFIQWHQKQNKLGKTSIPYGKKQDRFFYLYKTLATPILHCAHFPVSTTISYCNKQQSMDGGELQAHMNSSPLIPHSQFSSHLQSAPCQCPSSENNKPPQHNVQTIIFWTKTF